LTKQHNTSPSTVSFSCQKQAFIESQTTLEGATTVSTTAFSITINMRHCITTLSIVAE